MCNVNNTRIQIVVCNKTNKQQNKTVTKSCQITLMDELYTAPSDQTMLNVIYTFI